MKSFPAAPTITSKEPKRHFQSRLPTGVTIIFVLVGILMCLGHNVLLGIGNVVGGFLIFKMAWRQGEAQVPLLICGYQWFQVFATTLQAELYGAPVNLLYGGEEFESAAWLGLLSVIIFTAAFTYPLRKRLPLTASSYDVTLENLRQFSSLRLTTIWAGLLLADIVMAYVLKSIPSLAIIWVPIGKLRFAAALLLFQSIFASRSGWGIIAIIIAVETAIGFLGFFSNFKPIYFVIILAVATFIHARKYYLIGLAATLIVFLGFGFFWQAIKGDYRDSISRGEKDQAVNVTTAEQIAFLQQAAMDISSDSLVAASVNTLRRIEYSVFFGLCMRQVPDSIPHTNGRLWGEAVTSVFMPRALFPNKKVFNDSDRTNEFSGIRVADASEGTSIGIGYFGESYIDFGAILMFIPIGLFGLLIGSSYAWLVQAFKQPCIGIAIGLSLNFSTLIDIASSNAKMLPAFVSTFLVYWFLIRVTRRWWFKPSGT
jgi:hypothetical protein